MDGTLPNQEGANTAGAFPDPFADAIPGIMMQKIIQISAWYLRWFSIEFFDDLTTGKYEFINHHSASKWIKKIRMSSAWVAEQKQDPQDFLRNFSHLLTER